MLCVERQSSSRSWVTSSTLIQSVAPVSFTGMKDDQFQRTVVVKNTRFGKITELHFTDQRDKPWIDISVPGGTVVASSSTVFRADFDGNFIKNFGDGDVFFEKDEVVTFTETVTINECGFPPPDLPHDVVSKFRVGWGCNAEICRYDSATAIVHIEKSTKAPNLLFSVKSAPTLDKCGQTPATQRILLKNIGSEPAKSAILELVPPFGQIIEGGFVPNSFRLVTSNGSVAPLAPVLAQDMFFQKCSATRYSSCAFNNSGE